MAGTAGAWVSGASTAEAASRLRQRTWPPTVVKHRDWTLASVAAAARTMRLSRLSQPEAHRQSPCKYASAGGNTGLRDTAGSMIVAFGTMRCT